MTIHYLKTDPTYFDAVCNGIKKAEFRLDDRNYKVGDTLHLREFRTDEYAHAVWKERPTLGPGELSDINPNDYYTGRYVDVKVTHILRLDDLPDDLPDALPDGIPDGYVVLSVEVVG